MLVRNDNDATFSGESAIVRLHIGAKGQARPFAPHDARYREL